MIITLDLNLIEDNTEEAYNQDEDLSEVFYCNKMENSNEDYENNENFENLDNEKNISKRFIDENYIRIHGKKITNKSRFKWQKNAKYEGNYIPNDNGMF